ncbi:MAG: 3'-5' exonuclease [Synechococcales bacterium]|nr:3'-5' exonuclease [Synechococcales bacterium]
MTPPLLSPDLLTYYRRLSQHPFTVVDLETTGRRPPGSRILEISVLHASLADGIRQQVTDLINPQIPIPEKISEFTGITPDMVSSAPSASEVLPTYLPLLSTGILTAHNLAFDYAFLTAEFKRIGLPFSRPSGERLCTVKLARLMLAHLPSRSLPHLVQEFQFPVNTSHRAAADALACWLLVERLFTELHTETDEVLLNRLAQEWMPLPMAAKLLGCSRRKGQALLEAAQVTGRPSRNGQSTLTMYRRGDVERLVYERQGGVQLSWI